MVAASEAVEKDGFPAERDTERRCAVVMCWATGHALGAGPFPTSVLANLASGILKRGACESRICNGHIGSIVTQQPLFATPLLWPVDHRTFLHVLFMFYLESKQAKREFDETKIDPLSVLRARNRDSRHRTSTRVSAFQAQPRRISTGSWRNGRRTSTGVPPQAKRRTGAPRSDIQGSIVRAFDPTGRSAVLPAASIASGGRLAGIAVQPARD